MSHIKHIIALQAATRAQVIALLEITEVQYGEYLMQQGIAYLNDQLGGNPIGRELEQNAPFWAWWRNHWHDVDIDFVDECKYMNREERREYYQLQHDHTAFTYTPPRLILRAATKTKRTTVNNAYND